MNYILFTYEFEDETLICKVKISFELETLVCRTEINFQCVNYFWLIKQSSYLKSLDTIHTAIERCKSMHCPL